MRWPTRLELAIYVVAAALVVVIGVRSLRGSREAEAPAAPIEREATPRVAVREPTARVVVHVVGAVRRPGVYALRDGQRVRDVLRRAGGPTGDADLAAVNLAARVADAQQVVVPRRGAAAAAAGGGAAASPSISLATATVEQLDTLDGVGPATAEKIVAYRTQHGGFRTLDELAEVPGIGPKKLDGLRGQLQP